MIKINQNNYSTIGIYIIVTCLFGGIGYLFDGLVADIAWVFFVLMFMIGCFAIIVHIIIYTGTKLGEVLGRSYESNK